jgi:hypothetical protein
MKKLLLLAALGLPCFAFSQKSEYFKDVQFDSSYSVIGLCQGYGKPVDSLERFWFIVDDLAGLNQLKKEWVFKEPVARVHAEDRSINIYIIKNKREVANWSIIFPDQGIILSGNRYYKFDTAQLIKLHAAHPLHYQSQKMQFDTYAHYAGYGNGLLQEPKLLFFYEPSTRYPGSFNIYTRRTDQPIFTLRDINKELRLFDPAGNFQAGETTNDSFNLTRKDSVRFVVQCSKSLYEQYQAIGREKGPWKPKPIEITTFWRDDK